MTLDTLKIDNITIDEFAVDEFAKAMKEKLAKARAKGRSGWNDKEACSDEHLAMLFNGHLLKCNDGNFIDLANFLMFLHVRGAKPNVLIGKFLDCSLCKNQSRFGDKNYYSKICKECNFLTPKYEPKEQ